MVIAAAISSSTVTSVHRSPYKNYFRSMTALRNHMRSKRYLPAGRHHYLRTRLEATSKTFASWHRPPLGMEPFKMLRYILCPATLFTPILLCLKAVVTWWTQISRHGMRSNMQFLPSDHTRPNAISSWTKVNSLRDNHSFIMRFEFINAQMAWWNTLRLGCAIQHCGPVYVISCMYSPG